MTPPAPAITWQDELMLTGRTPPLFFPDLASVEAAGTAQAQAHYLRRAFEALELDGILCQGNAPIAYFREVPQLTPELVSELHRRFWNLGVSPLLVLIDATEVHVYSGLATPRPDRGIAAADERLVTRLDRVAQALEVHQLTLAIESGEIFHREQRAFDRNRRVDRQLLQNLKATRAAMAAIGPARRNPRSLDNFLCRVVFTSYLFDRGVIDQRYLRDAGLSGVATLCDLAKQKQLYRLFERLSEDFNGDLFSDDLADEARGIREDHWRILESFLSGTDIVTGQGSFWPYDFSVIPIETISAIYEHFLKAADPDAKKEKGAFYTPRFLAEITLDMALDGVKDLLGKRFLDPACGSGVFLVGLFNRLAREWSLRNPEADYTRRADGLIGILKKNLVGADVSPTACRIAAFSLYLALLDQLKPPQIHELQKKKRFLPPLVSSPSSGGKAGTIHCGDFFDLPVDPCFDVAVGNPPWASLSGPEKPAEQWCTLRNLSIANRQVALAFVWKTAEHVANDGRICFVLPNGVLFNHHAKALQFQREWFSRHGVESVLNLSDFQRFLFEEAEFPAVVIRYRPTAAGTKHVSYLSPKTDWGVLHAEVVSVAPEDRTDIPVSTLLADLKDPDAPLPWKVRFWATPRDLKVIDRLSSYPRLAAITSQPRSPKRKRWLAAQGFIPEAIQKPNSKPNPWLKNQLFLDATSDAIDLFVIPRDASALGDRFPWLLRPRKAQEIFQPPHVLVTKGLRAAYCGYSVLFRHALQGIHGPEEDRHLLQFLSAYFNSPLARFYLFHTTSSWGVNRAEVHLDELLSAPFLLPEDTKNSKRARSIVAHVSAVMDRAIEEASQPIVDRRSVVEAARREITPLIYEYFDVDETERVAIEDTNEIVIPSTRPTNAASTLATLKHPSAAAQAQYIDTLTSTLNDWARGGPQRVSGRCMTAAWSGVGAVELRRFEGAEPPQPPGDDKELLATLDRLRKVYRKQLGSVELLRGLKVFNENALYLFKPLQMRFWTRTAALNDADSIAANILSSPLPGL
jgi:hypothetical protein